jgi:hypothetical protein
MPLAEFKIKIDSKWCKPNEFKVLLEETNDEDSGVEDADQEEVGDDDETMEMTDDESE